MIYFTSDLHLGHAEIVGMSKRPFSSVEEMDEALIENWNSRVHKNDDVYILGDLIYKSARPPEEYLSRLRGKKHLIFGNHDLSWKEDVDLSRGTPFSAISRSSPISANTRYTDICTTVQIRNIGAFCAACRIPSMRAWTSTDIGP